MMTRPNPAPQSEGSSLTAREYVRTLTPEVKEAVLAELLEQAVEKSGEREPIMIPGRDGGPQGYYVPREAAPVHLRSRVPALSPERRETLKQSLATPEMTFDINDFSNELSQADQD